MERNVLADRLKGYACFLVLFGHVILGMHSSGVEMPAVFYWLEPFIWSFHVALFLFLNGAVYRITGEWKSKKTKSGFIVHKAISLGVPYLIFSVVYIGINSVVGQTNTQSSFGDILYLWKTPVAQYWYLYALFFLFCIWTVLADTLKNRQITVFIVLSAYLAPAFGVSFGCFDVVMFSALAFGLGTCIPISAEQKVPVTIKALLVLLHIGAGIVLYRLNLMETAGLKEALTVLGIFASIMLISMLQNIGFIAWFLDFVNKYSFQTYLLHTIFTAGFRIVLLRLGVAHWTIHLVVGCVAGLGLSVLAAVIAKKVPILDACFFPTKWIATRKMKKES
ncbi:MAG: acyltransferase [Clostridia bacterium]|nr:acyltransferase [Clostridia bacterium]